MFSNFDTQIFVAFIYLTLCRESSFDTRSQREDPHIPEIDYWVSEYVDFVFCRRIRNLTKGHLPYKF